MFLYDRTQDGRYMIHTTPLPLPYFNHEILIGEGGHYRGLYLMIPRCSLNSLSLLYSYVFGNDVSTQFHINVVEPGGIVKRPKPESFVNHLSRVPGRQSRVASDLCTSVIDGSHQGDQI